jgi:hypothetical protein
VIRQGDPLVIRVDYQSDRSGIFYGYRFWHVPLEIRVGGQAVHVGNREDWRRERCDWVRSDYSPVVSKLLHFGTEELPVGGLSVEYTASQVFLCSRHNRSTSSPAWSWDVRLTGEVEVLPANAPDPVMWVEDPSLTRELEESITLRFDYVDEETGALPIWWGEDQTVGLRFAIWADPPTQRPVAFDLSNLVVEVGDRRLRAGVRFNPWWDRGHPNQSLILRTDQVRVVHAIAVVPRFEEEVFFVLLPSDRDVARRTVDLLEAWKGELRFGPFKVEHIGPDDDRSRDSP